MAYSGASGPGELREADGAQAPHGGPGLRRSHLPDEREQPPSHHGASGTQRRGAAEMRERKHPERQEEQAPREIEHASEGAGTGGGGGGARAERSAGGTTLGGKSC